jgi:hypothetical protein
MLVRKPILLLCLLGFSQCKNFLGNPYPKAAPSRTVPVSNGLRVEPGYWWTNPHDREVDIMAYREGIAGYSVKLGPVEAIKLLRVTKDDDPNAVCITLLISDKAKSQTVPFIFFKGKTSFAYAFRVFPSEMSPNRVDHRLPVKRGYQKKRKRG